MGKTVKTANYLCTLKAGEIVDEYQLLAKEYRKVLHHLKETMAENDSLMNKIHAQIVSKEPSIGEIAHFKNEIAELKASKAGLEMQLSNKKSEVIKLEGKNNELIKQVGDIHSNKYHLEKDLNATKDRNQFLQTELEANNIKIHQLEASIKELRWVVKRK